MFSKYLFLCVIAFTAHISAFSQKIKVTEEFDKFTKTSTIKTSSETLFVKQFTSLEVRKRLKVAIWQVAGVNMMIAQIITPEIERYDLESTITFLLDNSETVVISSIVSGYSEKYGGSHDSGYAFNTAFLLSEESIDLLREHAITDVRVHASRNVFDWEIKDKKQRLIMEMVNAFEQYIANSVKLSRTTDN